MMLMSWSTGNGVAAAVVPTSAGSLDNWVSMIALMKCIIVRGSPGRNSPLAWPYSMIDATISDSLLMYPSDNRGSTKSAPANNVAPTWRSTSRAKVGYCR
jgi:hypothetical protein